MAITKEFNKYKISYYTGNSGLIAAIINLYSDSVRVGTINFYKEGEILGTNSSGDSIRVYTQIERFNDIVTILRYEKPLYINFVEETLAGFISTGSEDAGEQEPS